MSESELFCQKIKKNTTNLQKYQENSKIKTVINCLFLYQFNKKVITKGNILSYLASFLAALGQVSDRHIIVKVIYLEKSNKKLFCDALIPQISKKKFQNQVNIITNIPIEIPRSIAINQKSITPIYLDVFGDASIVPNYSAVYVIVTSHQQLTRVQQLVNTKFLKK